MEVGKTTDNNTPSFKNFIKDNGFVGLAQILLRFKGLFFLPLIAKLLGVAHYGIWAQVGVTVGLLVPIATMGLGYTLTRYLPAETKETKRETFYACLIAGLLASFILSLMIFINSSSIANALFGGAQFSRIVSIISLLIPVGVLEFISLNFFRATSQFRKYAGLQLLSTSIEISLVVIAVLTGFGIVGAVFGLFIAKLFSFICIFFLVCMQIGIKIPNFSKVTGYLKFGLPLIFSNLSYWAVQSADRYIIAILKGIESVGIYSASYSLSAVTVLALSPLVITLSPTIAKLWEQKQIAAMHEYIAKSVRYFLMIGIPSAFGLTVLSNDLLRLLSTPEIAKSSVNIVPFIVSGFIFYGMTTFFVTGFFLKKKTYLTAFVWAAAGLMNLILNIFLIPVFGLAGAAFATLICFVLSCFFSRYLLFRNNLSFPIPFKFMFKSILASAIMSFLVLILKSPTWIGLLISILAGTLIYFIALFLSGGLEKDEIKIIGKGFKKIFKPERI